LLIKKYQDLALETAVYGEGKVLTYPILGMLGEAGEVANKYKKVLRGDYKIEEVREALLDECGDVLWYLNATIRDLGGDLESVCSNNIKKLQRRRKNGTILGSGDNR